LIALWGILEGLEKGASDDTLKTLGKRPRFEVVGRFLQKGLFGLFGPAELGF
jgi:hypothetical protein